MPIFKYQPFYQYNGPTRSDPFREELNANEVQRNISLFFEELRIYFTDVDAKFEKVSDGIVGISCEITQDDCVARVKKCLNNLDLFANKISA